MRAAISLLCLSAAAAVSSRGVAAAADGKRIRRRMAHHTPRTRERSVSPLTTAAVDPEPRIINGLEVRFLQSAHEMCHLVYD